MLISLFLFSFSLLVNTSFSFLVLLVPHPLLITGLFIGLFWTLYISFSYFLYF